MQSTEISTASASASTLTLRERLASPHREDLRRRGRADVRAPPRRPERRARREPRERSRSGARQGGRRGALPQGREARRADASPGPSPPFEKLAAKDDPAALEAYARYLVLTPSDDPAENRARDLARRAAEKARTIPRCLLAGELAENRNQRAIWIDRAEELAKKGAPLDERIDVLLARAGARARRRQLARRDPVLRQGPRARSRQRPREPRARRALLRGRAPRDGARARSSSRSRAGRARVALLRATAAALRDLDRTTEAEEIDGALRARSASTTRRSLADRIELALARRDPATAARWIERLVDTNPDSGRALAAAARAYVALGDRPKAIAHAPARARARARRRRRRCARSPTSTRSAGRPTSSSAS